MTIVGAMAAGVKGRLVQAAVTALRAVGIESTFARSTRVPQGAVCLNVGSGGYRIPGFSDLDVPSAHYDRVRSQSFISFDIRFDDLPFDDSSVDAIYCSHVIEHIEEQHVARFMTEAWRAMRPGGVLRIATPDGPFLWEVSKRSVDYWWWRRDLIRGSGVDPDVLHGFDYFVHEVNAPAFRAFAASGTRPYALGSEMSFDDAVRALGDPPPFDLSNISQHISAWSFDRIARLAGGLVAVPSKYRASISPLMQGPEFDRTHPEMSLYVDLMKPASDA